MPPVTKLLYSSLTLLHKRTRRYYQQKMRTFCVSTSTSSYFLLLLAGLLVLGISSTYAAPHIPSYPAYYSAMEGQTPEYLLQTLAKLKQALIAEDDLENSKRGLDLGLGRGYSGSQAAKHLMGMAAANFAGGPGRRRRSEEDAREDA